MGRGKVVLKKIENQNDRQVTFLKRQKGLVKKAQELAVLCEAEVGVVVFSNNNKLYEFCSSSMQQMITRDNGCVQQSGNSGAEAAASSAAEQEMTDLKQEIQELKTKQMQLLGRDLGGVDLKDLQQLEQFITERLIDVKNNKENVLKQELELSRMKEEKIALENEILRRQIDELQASLVPSNANACPVSGVPPASDVAPSQDSARAKNGELTTALVLGPPSPRVQFQRKRKTLEKETMESTD